MQATPRHLKTLLLASTALVFAAEAQAAPPAVNWSGCYIGGHVGAGSSRTSFTDPTGFDFAPLGAVVKVHGDGGLGGIQIGCDQLFMQNWLMGVGGDFSWAHIKGQTQDPFFASKIGGAPQFLNTSNDWLATATGRFGYVFDRLLFYGRGGAAWTEGKFANTNVVVFGSCGGAPVGVCDFTTKKTVLGWVAAIGAEYAFAPNVSIAMEFAHYDFGNHRYTLIDPTGLTEPANVKQRIEVVKIIFNYRFGTAGPP